MKTWHGIGAGMLLLVALTGCSAAAEPNPDEVSEWIGSWDESIPNSIGVLAGMATKQSNAHPGEGASMSELDAVDASTIEFSCFGEETMSVDYTVETEPTAMNRVEEDLVCDDSPHVLSRDVVGITAVTANGISPTGLGAWAVVVREKK